MDYERGDERRMYDIDETGRILPGHYNAFQYYGADKCRPVGTVDLVPSSAARYQTLPDNFLVREYANVAFTDMDDNTLLIGIVGRRVTDMYDANRWVSFIRTYDDKGLIVSYDVPNLKHQRYHRTLYKCVHFIVTTYLAYDRHAGREG